MFGPNSATPFGTGTGFGTGTTFGSQKTGTQFGASSGLGTSVFGKTQAGFGTSAFGSQPQSSGTTGLFGSTATNTGSLFGASTTGSLFGQQQPTTQSSFGGFGTGGTSLFGAAKSNTGTSVFQTPGQTSTFGSGTTTGFGTTAGSSLFGSTANKGTSLFGASQQTGSSLFGQSGASSAFQGIGTGNTTTGTPVKFNVVSGTDSMVKNGITTNISTRHQCITVMDSYANKCLEELRIEDYEAGRKTGASATTGFPGLATSTGSGGLFGNASTGFGATSTFGQKPTTGFGTSGSLFGSTTPSGRH